MKLVPDHLVVCVSDLEKASRSFLEKGLASVPGGRHPGHGTANRIVPLGDSYIELLAVVDTSEARASRFGTWAQEASSTPHRIDALCLRADDINQVAVILGVEPIEMSRKRPDGSVLEWRVAGIDFTIDTGAPFLVEWGVTDHELPGRTPVEHPAGDVTLASIDHSSPNGWDVTAERVLFLSGPRKISAEIQTEQGVIEL